MKKMIKYLAFILLTICLFGCPGNDDYKMIYIKNNSDKTVYYGFSYAYPDTGLKQIGQFPGEDGNISHRLNSGEQGFGFGSSLDINPILQLYIFDADVIEREPKDSVIAHYKVLKRYQFDKAKLDEIGWTITYP